MKPRMVMRITVTATLLRRVDTRRGIQDERSRPASSSWI